ncbi:MAG: hypothetical protein JW910_04650 [Anaerolineae bacterium]|nr:hypothetical protein [Anaerolineae bacterium]
MPSVSAYLEGPAGTGKTTAAISYLLDLLKDGVPAERVVVLVPQRTLGRPYQLALHEAGSVGDATIVTLAGIARRSLERFWPLVAGPAGFDVTREPVFLTIETAQYYMLQLVTPTINEGMFDAVHLTPPRIAAQLLDNMAKAAIAGFPFAEVADRLVAAWGDRHSSQLQVYRTSQTISEDYRAYCRERNLLDYAMQLEVFTHYLLPHELFRRDFASRYDHLIADNIEESGPLVHDFIAGWWDHWESALLVCDWDAGYRTFLGADPAHAERLRDLCEKAITYEEPLVMSPDLVALEHEVRWVAADDRAVEEASGDPLAALTYPFHTYAPEMIDWVAGQIRDLVQSGVPPREIVILAPFLSDSLRFALRSRLDEAGIPSLSHRPSRALREEPAARAMLTLMALAHPQLELRPPPASDVADMLMQVIAGFDPVRARLLTDIVYKLNYGGELGSFERIQTAVRERITYAAGERYEQLRAWLLTAAGEMQESPWPPDYFLSRLFGEVLSQPGFGFHADMESGRIAAQLVESARKFRQVLYPHDHEDWRAVSEEYLRLVQEGVLAALYAPNWRDETADAVFMAPAFTYLMRNRVADYQFWLDVGSKSWWERLDQPLTHPYVLTRDYPVGHVWTDDDENAAQQTMLYRVMVGLLRRCRKGVFLGIADLGEQGYEQRGPMLYLFQQILQRQGASDAST